MLIYQCAAPVGLLTRDMNAYRRRDQRRHRRSVCSGRSEPRHATRAVQTRRGHGAARWKPIGDARGTDVGADRVARFESLGNDPPRRRRTTATARADTRLERPRAAGICVHLRSLRKNRARMLPTRG